MTTPNSHHQSAWSDVTMLRPGALTHDVQVDVCVVGAGIAGLLVAQRLRSEGRSVAILEAGEIAGGETRRTTAHFSAALDDRFYELRRLHGFEGARLLAQSHAAAIAYVESVIARLGISCDWRRLDGYLTVNDQHADERDALLNQEADAAREAGLHLERVPRLPEPWPESMGPAIRFPAQAQCHPLALLRGVVDWLMKNEVRIFTGARVSQIKHSGGVVVTTDTGPAVRCEHVVVATNTPFNNLVALHTKQSGYQTYVVGLALPRSIFPAYAPILLWDGLWKDDTAYHYVRMHSPGSGQEDMLIVGGEDHKTGQGPEGDPFERLEAWARQRFPQCGTVLKRWSGEVMEPVDGVAYIGRNPGLSNNVHVVTGDSGSGMTHAAIAAMLIPDLILGRDNPWTTLYSPSRKVGLAALGEYARENANTVAQYRDWLRSGDVQSEEQIPAGEGAILARGLHHVAVYKDANGACTHLNATCPHLGGVVRWNGQEKTWDCPCHASRFDAQGRVMHGPANTDLKPAAVVKQTELRSPASQPGPTSNPATA